MSSNVFWIEKSEGLFEKGNETSSSVKHRDIYDYLSNCWLLEKGSVQRGWFVG